MAASLRRSKALDGRERWFWRQPRWAADTVRRPSYSYPQIDRFCGLNADFPKSQNALRACLRKLEIILFGLGQVGIRLGVMGESTAQDRADRRPFQPGRFAGNQQSAAARAFHQGRDQID